MQDAHEFLSTTLNLLSEELYGHLTKTKDETEKEKEKGKDKDKDANHNNSDSDNKKDTSKTTSTSATDKTKTSNDNLYIDLTDTPIDEHPSSERICDYSSDESFIFTSPMDRGDNNEISQQNKSNGTNGIEKTNGHDGTDKTNGTTNGTANGTNTNGTHNGKETETKDSKPKNLYEDLHFRSTICPTSKNFDCEVESVYTCKQCRAESKVKELYRDFSLDIPVEKLKAYASLFEGLF